MAHLGNPGEEVRCPVCGKGVLADITYDDAPDRSTPSEQQPESRQLDHYTCGHEVRGAELASADDALDIEQRNSEETAAPLPGEDVG
jgi:hypothetical protein